MSTSLSYISHIRGFNPIPILRFGVDPAGLWFGYQHLFTRRHRTLNNCRLRSSIWGLGTNKHLRHLTGTEALRRVKHIHNPLALEHPIVCALIILSLLKALLNQQFHLLSADLTLRYLGYERGYGPGGSLVELNLLRQWSLWINNQRSLYHVHGGTNEVLGCPLIHRLLDEVCPERLLLLDYYLWFQRRFHPRSHWRFFCRHV